MGRISSNKEISGSVVYIERYFDLPDNQYFEMLDYCQINKLSLIKFENLDVSDVSGKYDSIAEFHFSKQEDLILFKLRFG